MKRWLAFLVVPSCCVATVACHRAVGLTDQDKAAIRRMEETFSKAVTAEKPDWDTVLAAYYADDARSMVPNMPAAEGRQSIKAMFLRLPTPKDYKVTEVSLEGGDGMAYRHYAYEMAIAVPGAPVPVIDKGNGIEIFKKQPDGSWRVIRDIAVSALPAPNLNVPIASMAANAAPEVRKLADMVGRWQFGGTFKADPKAAAGALDLTLTCGWFAGGHQVVFRFGGTIAGTPFEEVGFYAYDAAARGHVFHSISNDGTGGPGKLTIQPGSWIHTQDVQSGGKSAKTRFTLAEMTPHGGSWRFEVSGAGPRALLGEGQYTRAK